MVNGQPIDLLNPPRSVFADTPQAKCEAKGWVWDSVTQTCNDPSINPAGGFQGTVSGTTSPELDKQIQKQAAQEAEQDARTSSFSALRNEQTGRLSGFTRGDRTLLGLSPTEVTELATKEAGLQELPLKGQAQGVLTQRAAQLQAQGGEFAGQIGDLPDEAALNQIKSTLTQGRIDHMAALASTVPGVVPDFLTGAGAAITFTKGKTLGAAPLIVGGLNVLRGVFVDYMSDITKQQSDTIETPIRTLTESKGVLTALIGMANSDPQNAQTALDAYNVIRTTIDMEYEHLKELSDNDLNAYLGVNGINQMKEYEVYYLPFGERWLFDQEMAAALANPDPSITKIPFDIQQLLKEKAETKATKKGGFLSEFL